MTDTQVFLNHLFAGVRGWMEITLIHPQHARGKNILTRFYELGVDTPDWDRIAELNDDGWGCYWGTTVTSQPPRYGRRKEADVTALSCLWCEFDYHDNVYATVDDVIRASGDFVPPTALVASGGGVHCLWRIAPVEITQYNRIAIKETLRGMAIAMKADTAATDLARVLRLVGTRNTKPARGAMCQLIDLIDGEYTLDTFNEYRQYAQPVKRAPARPSDLPPGSIPGYLKWFMTTTHPTGTRNGRLNWTAYQMWKDGFSMSDAESFLLPSALACGLAERDSLATIRSSYRK